MRFLILSLCLCLPASAAKSAHKKPSDVFDPSKDGPKLVRDWLKTQEGKDHIFRFQDEATGETRQLKLLEVHSGSVTAIRYDDVRVWAMFNDHHGAKVKVLLEFFLRKPEGQPWVVERAETFSVNGKPRKPYNEGYTNVPKDFKSSRTSRKNKK